MCCHPSESVVVRGSTSRTLVHKDGPASPPRRGEARVDASTLATPPRTNTTIVSLSL